MRRRQQNVRLRTAELAAFIVEKIMRRSWVFIALALALLSACASQPVDMISCPEPRPELCTMEFVPTCAVLAGGKRKEFASPCAACADELVTGYVSGGCSK